MISIVFCGDLRYCPYLSRYTDRLDKAKSKYEVLFWNRAGLKISLNSNYKYYNNPSAEDLSKWNKLHDFLGFRAWLKKQLSVSKPDGIIFLSTLSAVLLFDVAKKYKKRYIFDIRDYSYENIKVFRKIESCIIRDSYFTAISSKGFQAFLPGHDYVIAHNFNRNDIIENQVFAPQTVPYRIVWNGTVRFFDYQKKYLECQKKCIENEKKYLEYKAKYLECNEKYNNLLRKYNLLENQLSNNNNKKIVKSNLHKHDLKDVTLNPNNWYCNICMKLYKAQTEKRYRCEICDFDLCDKCLSI